MNIRIPILSILSTAFLLMFCVGGGELILDGLAVDFSISSSGVALDIHPTWLVWVSQERAFNHGGNAFAYGNVIVVGANMSGGTYEEYVINHERMHIEQFRALGLLVWPAQFFTNIEPPKHIPTNWDDPTQPSKTMWAPPKWWINQWSFITLTFDREET